MNVDTELATIVVNRFGLLNEFISGRLSTIIIRKKFEKHNEENAMTRNWFSKIENIRIWMKSELFCNDENIPL